MQFPFVFFANHLATVQWAVRPTTAVDGPEPLGDELPTELGPITEQEVCEAARALKRNRAAGKDGMPAEFWRAVCVAGAPACQWAVLLCNRCWQEADVPEAWHAAVVSAIFKKGDSADCANCRPISLLPIGYKLYAMILLSRLKKSGAEERIWSTQFGFRSGRGTADALFIGRCLIEDTWDSESGKLIFLALDWAKAFDSVSPDGLVQALIRFGAEVRIGDQGHIHKPELLRARRGLCV